MSRDPEFCAWCGMYFPGGQVCDRCRRRMMPPMVAAWVTGLAVGILAGAAARAMRRR